MLVTLEQSEVARVIKDWAYKVYKTHNINVSFKGGTTNCMELEIIGFEGSSENNELPEDYRRKVAATLSPATTFKDWHSLLPEETISGPSLDGGGV